MSTPADACVEVLVGALGLTQEDAKSHALTRHVLDLEQRSRQARLVFPAIYLAVGLVLAFILYRFDPSVADTWNKLFGAVVGVFSALLVFWKPTVELSQSDCQRMLDGKRLAYSDLSEINRSLALPTKNFENYVKLLTTTTSFIAIYLISRK